MAIDFFEKEVSKVRERFNQTYGVMVVCNLNHRQAAILSIINLEGVDLDQFNTWQLGHK